MGNFSSFLSPQSVVKPALVDRSVCVCMCVCVYLCVYLPPCLSSHLPVSLFLTVHFISRSFKSCVWPLAVCAAISHHDSLMLRSLIQLRKQNELCFAVKVQ